MIAIYILTAQMAGGFTLMPYATEALCYAAMDGLAVVVKSAECYQAEMIIPDGSIYAPIKSPIPPRKPGRSA